MSSVVQVGAVAPRRAPDAGPSIDRRRSRGLDAQRPRVRHRRHERPARRSTADCVRPRLHHRHTDRCRDLALESASVRALRPPARRGRVRVVHRGAGGVEQLVALQHRPRRHLGSRDGDDLPDPLVSERTAEDDSRARAGRGDGGVHRAALRARATDRGEHPPCCGRGLVLGGLPGQPLLRTLVRTGLRGRLDSPCATGSWRSRSSSGRRCCSSGGSEPPRT